MASLRWLCVVVLLGAAAPLARGQAALEWKLSKGDSFYVETTSTFKQSLKVPGKEVEVRQEVEYTAVLKYTVQDKGPDNTLVLEQRVEGLRLGRPGTTHTVADDKLKGVALVLTLNPKRQVVKVEKSGDLIKALSGDDSTVRRALEKVLSEEALKRSAAELFAFLPGKDAKSWEREFQRPLGPLGSLSVRNQYTRKGKESAEGRTADRIEFTSSVTYRLPSKEEMKDSPFQVVASKPGKKDAPDGLKVEEAKGVIHFDADAGRLVAATTSLKLNGPLTIELNKILLESVVQQELTTKTRVLDRNPIK
ncbi:MAG TPA: hypothetical protein VFA26_18275 [Gemmataceae bacterium]|nr:hypothetical protein [Gemmataceae bacterium]